MNMDRVDMKMDRLNVTNNESEAGHVKPRRDRAPSTSRLSKIVIEAPTPRLATAVVGSVPITQNQVPVPVRRMVAEEDLQEQERLQQLTLRKENRFLHHQLKQLQIECYELRQGKVTTLFDMQVLRKEVTVLQEREQQQQRGRESQINSHGNTNDSARGNNKNYHDHDQEEDLSMIPKEFSFCNHELLLDFEFETQKLQAQKKFYQKQADSFHQLNQDLHAQLQLQLHMQEHQVSDYDIVSTRRKYELLKSVANECHSCSRAYCLAYQDQVQVEQHKPCLQLQHQQSTSHRSISGSSNKPEQCRNQKQQQKGDIGGRASGDTHAINGSKSNPLLSSCSTNKREQYRKQKQEKEGGNSGHRHHVSTKKLLQAAMPWHGSKRSSLLSKKEDKDKVEQMTGSSKRLSTMLSLKKESFKWDTVTKHAIAMDRPPHEISLAIMLPVSAGETGQRAPRDGRTHSDGSSAQHSLVSVAA
jgi:hypothetical protein